MKKAFLVCKQCCILFLMLDAMAVFIGQVEQQNMWPLIVAYWFVLFVKNAIDYLEGIA